MAGKPHERVNISKEFLFQEYVINHKSFREIAKELNCSRDTIENRAKKYGIIARKHQERGYSVLNKKFGKLLVIKQDKLFKNYPRYICLCDCGRNVYARPSNLVNNITIRCKICNRKKNSQLNWMGYKDISKTYWNIIKNGAYTRNLEFSITIEEIWNLYEKQNRKCALSGLDIYINSSYSTDNKYKRQTQTASLDRIDSTKGYVIDNVQWIHKKFQFMKNSTLQNNFIDDCKLIVINQNYKNLPEYII